MNSDSMPFQDVVDNSRESYVLARVSVLAAVGAVFLLDSFLAVDVAGYILYLPIIWLAFRTGKALDIYATAALCSVMLVIDLYISSTSDEVVWISVMNRLLGMFAIWLTAALCGKIVRAKRTLLSRERYRSSIVETAMDAVVSIDQRGRIVDWNAQAETTFGWTRSEVVGEELASRIIPPEYRTAQRQGLARFLKTGMGPILGQRVELTALRKNGEEFPIELSVVAVSLDGKVLFNAFVRDISQKSENSKYRARLAALVDSSYDAIIGIDIDGTINSWNLGAERVYGYREEETLGRTIDFLLPPDIEEETKVITEAIHSGRRLEQFETIRKRKDGQLLSVSVTVSPIADENGVDIGSSTIERDITERKRQQKELFVAKEDAEKANRSRAEFLANVSHELRTPMNAIIGMTQIALGEKLTDDVEDYIRTANESAHSLLTLVNDILDFSKLESGKFTIENEPFHLREMLDVAIKPLSLHAFDKGLELACDVASNVPDELVGDTVRLKQVLTNLINNAVKFTDAGEVVVAVETLKKWPSKVRLRFSVRDTGVGILPDDQRRILEPFTQVDASSTRRHGGTGLGLAICNQLLRLMGGKLSVESEPEKGSCLSFQVTLARQSIATRKPSEGLSLKQLQNLPVLVVDDNETNRRILAQMLKNWSMQPDTVEGAEQAIRRMDRACENGAPYPLVILDAQMPGVDGYTLSRRICERTTNPPPIILMISSSDRQEFKQRETESGVDHFLQKPVSQSDLLDAVMQAMHVQVDETNDEVNPHNNRTSHRSLSVLLAEDTPANQKVVRIILQKYGHTVTVAQNGQEAIQLYHDRAFDVILMDVQMPVMDGYKATAKIRAVENDSKKSTPIIAMTAHAMRGDREKCLAAGMDAYLSKPVDVEELVQLVENASLGRDNLHDLEDDYDFEESAEIVENASSTPQPELPASPDDVVDYAGTMRRLNGDKNLFLEFIGYFQEDSPKLLEDLGKAIDAADPSAVQHAAHSLKGIAANFGAENCLSTANELEQLGKAGDLTGAKALQTQLEQHVAQLDLALAKYRE
ncbi:Signal transduction histidine-protein kinase BarA [Symmachiella dynata]|uniref:Sensory/regulatory protein RpfC n=1 Tax=Symmachiella dynata TaxID=2527995 RepID=A0A517ZUK3_9PLAN|nr:response regulator [Symmachiella dynata]QDU46163.1 Signal transduction histidine-protein kinase BarA [Symmachiella dynata]